VPIVIVDFEALSEGSVEAAGSVAIVLLNGWDLGCRNGMAGLGLSGVNVR
jgi:hypothetical protein